jgi:hypothetical protein
MKNAMEVPVKGAYVVLNKTTAAVLLTVMENSVEFWSEMGRSWWAL